MSRLSMQASSGSLAKNAPCAIVWNAPSPAGRHRHAGRARELRNSPCRRAAPARAGWDSTLLTLASAAIFAIASSSSRARGASAARSVGDVRSRSRPPAAAWRPALAAPRPALRPVAAAAAPPACATPPSRPNRRRRDRDRIEHARLREAADELILEADAEATPCRTSDGDADRHAEHRERRAQLRLAEIAERESNGVHETHATDSETIAPSSIVTVRCAYFAARPASCVTMMTVLPSRSFRSLSSAMISRDVLLSRLPVGSSASSRCRLIGERARDRHALLLAARQLARPMPAAAAEADRFEQRRRPGVALGARHAGEHHRQRHVLRSRSSWRPG